MKQLFSRNGTAGSKDGDPSRTGEQTSGQGFPQLIAWRVLPNPHQEKRNPSRAERIPIEMEWRARGSWTLGRRRLHRQRTPRSEGPPQVPSWVLTSMCMWETAPLGGRGNTQKSTQKQCLALTGAKRTAYSQQPDWEILGWRRVNYPNWTWRVTLTTMHSPLGACNTIKKW